MGKGGEGLSLLFHSTSGCWHGAEAFAWLLLSFSLRDVFCFTREKEVSSTM